jgi:chemotaxis protein histidine kinase CheA
MATLTEYFETEARDFLLQLERGVQTESPPDATQLQRAARALRGTAQMAREERVFRATSAFEAVLRALANNTLAWSDDVRGRARETVSDLRALVMRGDPDEALDQRADALVARWRQAGVDIPQQLHGPTPPPADGTDIREFREYAAREVMGVAEALDRGVQQLAASPMDRDPLKMILRRQRAMLGATRLDEIPVIAEVLRAIEDLTRVIAKLDVGVKQEWLDIYRVAREALKAAIDPLQRNEDPQPTHALSRLRHMREELMERYGAGDPAAAASPDGGFSPVHSGTIPADGSEPAHGADSDDSDEDDAPNLLAAAANAVQRAVGTAGSAVAAGMTAAATTVQAVAEAIAPPGVSPPNISDDIVPIEQLQYSSDGALQRAMELRSAIEPLVVHDPGARAAVDELFDLIRLARS